MAKKKVKYIYRKKRSKQNKSNNNGFSLKGLSKPVGSMIYGALREEVSDRIARTQLAQKLPVTQFTDEAVMLALMYAGKRIGLSRSPIGKAIIYNGEAVEWARIGATAKDMLMKKKVNGTAQTQTAMLF